MIRGKVRGVGFRFSTVEVARDIGLSGWVRNLTAGEVEVLASGHPDALDRLENWLYRDPSVAGVTKVVATGIPYRESLDFQARPTVDSPDRFDNLTRD
ncbi:acylphosphatase [Pannus brasiliensis CCIBt3594]|uniref:acylphosphatase n=1 Tax=Pannus brasiliensis CCIBt3594 TaxID=1427578 RepID=A0AAW9QNV5_9CHRO